jgi:hypothetical protein
VDVLFLQLSLQSTGRTFLEGSLQHLRAAAPSTLLGGLLALVLGGLEAALGAATPGQLGNGEAVACLTQLEQLAQDEGEGGGEGRREGCMSGLQEGDADVWGTADTGHPLPGTQSQHPGVRDETRHGADG